VVDNPDMRRFEARAEDAAVAGFVRYGRRPQSVILLHTEVDEAFHGQGVGSRLVRGTLDQLLAEGVTVVNECPFIERFIQRHSGEYESVVRAAAP